MSEGKGQSEKEKEDASEGKDQFTREERTEYFSKLEQWLIEAYAWHSFVGALPYIVASSQVLHSATPIATTNIGATLANATINTGNDNSSSEGLHQRRVNEAVPAAAAADFQVPGDTGITYKIPPIWKRFVAEFIDSMLLFVLKLSITFIAVDVFDLIDIEKYYLDPLQTNLSINLRIDYKMAWELTSGILILELIHRVLVCIFEASWLQYGRNGRIGGATPGKSVMKLKVVLCRTVAPVGRPDEELVLVGPGTDLGLMPALGRSILKNLTHTFFFPIFALCFFRFNRTGYDLFCNTIVVEDAYRNGNNNINNNNNNNNFNNNNNINNERLHQQ